MMARLDRMSAPERDHYLNMPCSTFDTAPWVVGPPLTEQKVALISTAGLHRRGDRPFSPGASDYRLIPADTPSTDLVMSHISTNFDRTGFQQDWKWCFRSTGCGNWPRPETSAVWPSTTIPLWGRQIRRPWSRAPGSWPKL